MSELNDVGQGIGNSSTPTPPDLTAGEKEVLHHLVAAHNTYVKLRKTHPSDITEWVNGLHTLQKLVAMRHVRRTLPHIFPTHDVE